MARKKDEVKVKTSNSERYGDSMSPTRSPDIEGVVKTSRKRNELKSNVEKLLEEIRDILLEIKGVQ